jgi:hypothetical protein
LKAEPAFVLGIAQIAAHEARPIGAALTAPATASGLAGQPGRCQPAFTFAAALRLLTAFPGRSLGLVLALRPREERFMSFKLTTLSARLTTLSATLLLATSGCAGDFERGAPSGGGGGGGKADSTDRGKLPQIADPLPDHRDGYNVTDAWIEGATLVVDVSYSGGCATHDFELYWNGLIAETFPARASFRLVHDANGDFCEAIIRGDVRRFDLSELGTGPTLISLDVFEGEPRILELGAKALPQPEVADPLPDHVDGFAVNDARIEGSTLVMDVSYSGGCAKHDFDLYWDGLIAETFPARASFRLVHDANGDFCEAFISSDVRHFDLSVLGAGHTLIGLDVGSGTTLVLEYGALGAP